MTVEISVSVRKEGIIVTLGVGVDVASIVEAHKPLLLLGLSDVLNGVAAPNLPLFDDSAWWDNAIRSEDVAFTEESTLHDN